MFLFYLSAPPLFLFPQMFQSSIIKMSYLFFVFYPGTNDTTSLSKLLLTFKHSFIHARKQEFNDPVPFFDRTTNITHHKCQITANFLILPKCRREQEQAGRGGRGCSYSLGGFHPSKEEKMLWPARTQTTFRDCCPHNFK